MTSASTFNPSRWHYIGQSSCFLWCRVSHPDFDYWFECNHHDRLLGSCGNPDAKRLYDDLLSNYNKLVRPVVNVTDAVTVRLKLKLSQLIDVVSDFFEFYTVIEEYQWTIVILGIKL